MSAHLDAETYRTMMYGLGLGQALYDPGPDQYDHVRVGDVGYVHHGSFKRLFNACFDGSDQANENSILPEPFVPLDPRFRGVSGTRHLDSGIRKSRAVKATEASTSASVPIVMCARLFFYCHA